MKKIANYLIALAVAAFTFTSCEDVPSPFGTVVQPDSGDEVVIEPQGSGTKSDPYNVAGALEFISGLGADVPSDKEIYVKGFVTSIKEQFSAQYGNAQFTMSDTKEGANTFTFFRGLYLGNKKWVEGDLLLAEGDEVIICGKVVNYKGNTPETVQNAAYTYSINGKSEGGGGDTPTSDLGTKDAPITVAKALEAISKLADSGETSTEAYVKGKISKVQSYNATYKSITYYISDDGKEANELQIYSGKNIGGAEFASKDDLAAGDEVVVKGKLKKFVKDGTATPEMNQPNEIITITKGSGGGGGGDGEAKGTGTANDPFNIAAAIAKCKETGETATNEEYYIKGLVDADFTVADDNYKNATFDMVDAAGSAEKFKAFRVYGPNGQKLKAGYKIPKGATVIVCGKIVNYKGNTPETVQTTNPAYNGTLISVNGKAPELDGGSGGGGGSSETASSLTNGDFETWANGQPTGWKSTSTASNATLEQSTDAHGGKYACIVKGDEGNNKRLASQEIKLSAGTYTFSFWVKPTTGDASQVNYGYVPIGSDGKPGTYKYAGYATLTASWQQLSYEFTLEGETTVCLVVMNPKKSNYSSGKDVLIDDASLTKK